MSDLKKYIKERKKRDKGFAKGFEEGYEQFKIGVVLRQARKEGLRCQVYTMHRWHPSKSWPFQMELKSPRGSVFLENLAEIYSIVGLTMEGIPNDIK